MNKLMVIFFMFMVFFGFTKEDDGQHYDKHSNNQFESSKKSIRLIENQLKENFIVYDIGCGTGKLAYWLAKNKVPNGSVIGVDLSADRIKTAKEKQYNEYANTDNLHFVVGDAQNLELKENSADLVTCFACLHFVPDHKAAFTSMASCLKKDGLLMATCAPKRYISKHPFLQAMIQTAQEAEFKDHIKGEFTNSIYTADIAEWDQLAKDCGLDILENGIITRTYTFDTKEDFSGFLLGWLVGVKGFSELPKEIQPVFLKKTIENYLTLQPKVEGQIIYKISGVRLLARKK